jgi:hypothetical protein
MDRLVPDVWNHILRHLNTRYVALNLVVSKYYYWILKKYLHGKEISAKEDYIRWILSFMDSPNYTDLSIDIKDINEEIRVASGNIVHINLSKSTCKIAARYGHLHVLKWARESGCGWNQWTCVGAARGGYLHVLQWARENGCEWNEWTCSYAARGGHLHVLKWARENGCKWDPWVCSYAARGGHLHVLKWARENGCEWGGHVWKQQIAGICIYFSGS